MLTMIVVAALAALVVAAAAALYGTALRNADWAQEGPGRGRRARPAPPRPLERDEQHQAGRHRQHD